MIPAVSAVVLAAGRGRRFGATKQLVDLDGRPLVRIVVDAASAASLLAEVIVVTGHEADAVRTALAGVPAHIVFNPGYEEGQSSSVRAGLACVATASAGAMFVPADQPGLTSVILDALAAGFAADPQAIVVPVYAGQRGSPVVFPRDLFSELASLEGDVGGRALLPRFASRIREVAFDSAAPLTDIDTPDDRDRWLRAARR